MFNNSLIFLKKGAAVEKAPNEALVLKLEGSSAPDMD